MTRIHQVFMALMATLYLAATPMAQAEPTSNDSEIERAEAYAAAICRCMFDHYKPTTPEAPGMRICMEQANATHTIPDKIEETFTVEVGPTKVTHPKLFTSDGANQRYAEQHQACMLKFSLAVQDYQSRTWSDSICMGQCRDEGDQKKLCNTLCMDARLPSPTDAEATPDEQTTTEPEATSAPESCEDQCDHLNGRSKKACTRTCEKEQGQ